MTKESIVESNTRPTQGRERVSQGIGERARKKRKAAPGVDGVTWHEYVTRKEFMESVATAPPLIIDDFGMRKLPLTAAEDLLPARCSLPTAPSRTAENYWAAWQR